MPLRTTARMTAFRPGQSPPPVRMPILISFSESRSSIVDRDDGWPTYLFNQIGVKTYFVTTLRKVTIYSIAILTTLSFRSACFWREESAFGRAISKSRSHFVRDDTSGSRKMEWLDQWKSGDR